MPLDYDTVMGWPFAPVEQSYDWQDAALYALGIGIGADPTDPRQLAYVYEGRMTSAFPTIAAVIGHPGFWVRDAGIDWKKVLHAEQGLDFLAPMPPSGTVIGQTKVDEIVDKGAEKGALLFSSRELRDKGTGTLYCRAWQSVFCRGDGGFGGPTEGGPPPHALPDRAPDMSCDLPTLPQSALIYRLSGDLNPLHADPEIAAAAGFDRPILHGLCTYGVAGHAIVRSLCDYDGTRLRALRGRFSAPVYPGETIRTDIWEQGDGVFGFRCRVVERDLDVIRNGRAEIAPA